jgi:hypothetical protein
MTKKPTKPDGRPNLHYDSILGDISNVIDAARQSTARSVNCIMTAAYWLIGRRIVEFEQKGKRRAEYGEALIEKLAGDLSAFYGKGFSIRNVWQMKAFYLAWPILQTVSAESEDCEILQTVCRIFSSRHRPQLFTPLVGLCAPPVGEERECPTVLRDRSSARRLVGAAIGPADQFPVL